MVNVKGKKVRGSDGMRHICSVYVEFTTEHTYGFKVEQCSLHAQQHKVSPSCMIKRKVGSPHTTSPLPLMQVMLEKLRKMDAEVLKCIEALILGCRCGQHT